MQKENISVEPIKEYYIAYFDLLGYKNFLKTNPEKAGDFLNTIHGALQNTKAYIQDVNSSHIVGKLEQVSIQAKIFSDNILLCLERRSVLMEPMRFLTFIAIVADIQRNFILQYDLFLRGGITIGMLSFNNDFIFGEGLIDAVALEETAKYPRIIMGKTVLDYVSQTHFVKSEDLKKACEIENRVHTGEYISDEDLAFYDTVVSNVKIENFYLQWRDHLIFKTADEMVVLNYLYYIDISTMIDQVTKEQILEFVRTISPSDFQRLDNLSPDQKECLEQHKTHIIRKIKEFGNYDSLEISAIQEADARERILKKYLWVLSFHNYVCMVYDFPECMIKSGSTFDIRFMRMTAEIFEDNPQ